MTTAAFENEFTRWLRVNELFNRAQQSLGDQDLARLGLAAKTGDEVGDGADGPVVPAS